LTENAINSSFDTRRSHDAVLSVTPDHGLGSAFKKCTRTVSPIEKSSILPSFRQVPGGFRKIGSSIVPIIGIVTIIPVIAPMVKSSLMIKERLPIVSCDISGLLIF
jgi:hypothetical protein